MDIPIVINISSDNVSAKLVDNNLTYFQNNEGAPAISIAGAVIDITVPAILLGQNM